MSIPKSSFAKHQFLRDYAQKASEFFYEEMKKQRTAKIESETWYAFSVCVDDQYIRSRFDPYKCAPQIVCSFGLGLGYVRDYNMRPIEGREDQETLQMFLAELVAENIKGKLRSNPMDRVYNISLEGCKVVYTAKSDAYLSRKEW